MRTVTVWQALMLPPWRFLLSSWPWRSLAYVVLSAVLALVLVPLGIVTILFLPLWAIALAAGERHRLRLLGVPRPPSGHVRVPREERRNWLSIRLAEPATWRGVVVLLADVVLGAVAVVLLFALATTLVLLVGVPVAARRTRIELNLFADAHVFLGPEDWWLPLLLLPPALIVGAYLLAALAAGQSALVRWLLAPRARELDARVERLSRSRAAIGAAHEAERRRIERDLHDGVQQELVAVAVRLGLVDLELQASDVPAARRALREAQAQAEGALAALRETVRGIHPAVLSDRGLAAAVEELAGRAALPVRLLDRGFPRLPPAAEAACYFFVAEAITNAAKHTSASAVTVVLDRAAGKGTTAVVTVTDNGQGGARPVRDGGLRGLAERAEALDGSLDVRSPAGGPTVLTLAIPCAAPPAGGAAARVTAAEKRAPEETAPDETGAELPGTDACAPGGEGADDAHPARR